MIDDLKGISLKEKNIFTLLEKEFTTTKSVINTRKKLQDLKNSIDETLFELVIEELKEIQEDLVWSKSERGKYILKINDWFDSFKDEFRSIKEYDNIYIGGHPDILCIIVTGKINEHNRDDLMQFLVEKEPPYKLKTQFI